MDKDEEKILLGSILSVEDNEMPVKRDKKKILSLAPQQQNHDLDKSNDKYTDKTPQGSESHQSTNVPSHPNLKYEEQRQNQKHNSYNFSHLLEIRENERLPHSKKHLTQQYTQTLGQFQSYNSDKAIKHISEDPSQYLDQICGNQNASRNLQRIFEQGGYEERYLIFETVLKNLKQCSKDQFGNYTVQKIFTCGEYEWKKEIFQRLRGQYIELSKNIYSSRVIQRVIEFVKNNDNLEDLLLSELLPYGNKLLQDQNGSFVILKCFETLKIEKMKNLIPYIEENIYQLSQQTYGCRIIQLLLFQQNRILENIIPMAEKLCFSEFGNYIIQHLLKKGQPKYQQYICNIIKANFENLAINKYGSNIVEAMFSIISNEDIKQISYLLCNNQLFVNVSKNQYGNYVMKKFFMLDPKFIQPLIINLRKNPEILQNIRQSEFCHQLYQVIEKMM
ncbi:hypothetical protein pb186bvf_015665 [Paramecium bursaria]